MLVSNDGLHLIRTSNPLSLTPCLMPSGSIGIGYGHAIWRRGGALRGVAAMHEALIVFPAPITEGQAKHILSTDAGGVSVAIRKLLPYCMAQNQFDALVAYVYNTYQGRVTLSCCASGAVADKVLPVIHATSRGRYRQAADLMLSLCEDLTQHGHRMAERELFLRNVASEREEACSTA